MVKLSLPYGYTKASVKPLSEDTPLISKSARSAAVDIDNGLTPETLSQIHLTSGNIPSKKDFMQKGEEEVLVVQISKDKLYFCGNPTQDTSNDTKITIPVDLKKVPHAKKYYEMERMVPKGITFEQSPTHERLMNFFGLNLRTRKPPVPVCVTKETTYAELFLDQLYNEMEKKHYVRYEDADITKCIVIIGKKFSAYATNTKTLIWFTWSTMFVDNLTGLLYVPGGVLAPVKNPQFGAVRNALIGLLSTMLVASPYNTPFVASIIGYIKILDLSSTNTIFRRAKMLKRRGSTDRTRFASGISPLWTALDKWVSTFLVFVVLTLRKYGTTGGFASSVVMMALLSMHGIFVTLNAGTYLGNIISVSISVVLFISGLLLCSNLSEDLFKSFSITELVSSQPFECQFSLADFMPLASVFCLFFSIGFYFSKWLPLPFLFIYLYFIVPIILVYAIQMPNSAVYTSDISVSELPTCFSAIDSQLAAQGVEIGVTDKSFFRSFSFLPSEEALNAIASLREDNEGTQFSNLLSLYQITALWNGISFILVLILLLIIIYDVWPRKMDDKHDHEGWSNTPKFGGATGHMLVCSTNSFNRENDDEEKKSGGESMKFSWTTDSSDTNEELEPLWVG